MESSNEIENNSNSRKNLYESSEEKLKDINLDKNKKEKNQKQIY